MGRKTKLKEARGAERTRPARQQLDRSGRLQRLLLVGTIVVALVAGWLGATFFIGDDSSQTRQSPQLAEEFAAKLGAPFPAFRLTEANAKVLTRATLRGKPAIIWFTTAYCVPCQIGARVVAQLDHELGEKRFNVLVVFVDPNERVSDLTRWRRQFGSADWMVALDRDLALAQRVGLRFLDSKFLLDKDGVTRNIDLTIADEDYLKVIRKAVGAAV